MTVFCNMLCFVLLFGGFFLLSLGIRSTRPIEELLRRALAGSEQSSRKMALDRRKLLQEAAKKPGFLMRLDQALWYSGFKHRFPKLSPQLYLSLVLGLQVLGMVLMLPLRGFGAGLTAFVLIGLAAATQLRIGRSRNLRAVGGDLMKLLDFLGNYSISGGELAGILGQISHYLNEPLRSTLQECEAESAITGDVGAAVLLMAEKIEHPQFCQLARNLEITARYSADFSPLVMGMRRSLREFLRQEEERSSMLKEAAFNMALLTILSCFVLSLVGHLIGVQIPGILTGTLVGHIALGIFGFAYLLFFWQALSLSA